MIDDVQSAFANTCPHTGPEKEKDILYLIGRALLDHKENFYTCHKTGFTAEIAWPIMESILCNIRPYLASVDIAGAGRRPLPIEPTTEMVRAALETSIRLRREWEIEDVQPDSSGRLPSEMVRAVWRAMIETLPPAAMQEPLPVSAAPNGSRTWSPGSGKISRAAALEQRYTPASDSFRLIPFESDTSSPTSIFGSMLLKAGALVNAVCGWRTLSSRVARQYRQTFARQ